VTIVGTLTRIRAAFHTRAAFGLGPVTAPVVVFVPLGALLGPAGANLLTVSALARLDVVVSIALATLGVFVGIATGHARGRVGRLMAAAAAEGCVTALVVAAATFWLLRTWALPLETSTLIAAITLGIAAAASAAPARSPDGGPLEVAAHVADLDDVLPIFAGAVVMSMLVSGTDRIAVDLLLTLGIGTTVGLAGWLLFERAEVPERGVFVLGTLALVAGAAAYVGLSPLLAGLVAGFIWARTPGHTDRLAARDLAKVQHPLIILLLLITGAGLQFTIVAVWLFAPYLLFRLAGKLLGGWVASRIAPLVAPSDLASYLVSPGVLGIAFALNVQQVAPAAAGPLVFAVALGAAFNELLALLVLPAGHHD
jgi:hypothetical protein